MDIVLFFIFLIIILWLWQDSLRSREFAVKYCHDKCKELNLQLLDQTIALKSVALQRNDNGQLRIIRRYSFEFSIDGVNRYNGSILIDKERTILFQLDHPEGTLIVQGNEFIRQH